MKLNYSCRPCGRPIQSSEGCVFCSDFKKQLVVTGENDLSPIDITAEGLRLLKDQLAEYNADLKKATASDKEAIRRSIREVTAKLAILADSYRKLAVDRKDLVESLSIEEQKNLFIDWYANLPPSTRQSIIAAMSTREAELNMAAGSWKSSFNVQ